MLLNATFFKTLLSFITKKRCTLYVKLYSCNAPVNFARLLTRIDPISPS